VRKGGFEPPRLSAPPPQDGVSASSTTSALCKFPAINSLASSSREGISSSALLRPRQVCQPRKQRVDRSLLRVYVAHRGFNVIVSRNILQRKGGRVLSGLGQKSMTHSVQAGIELSLDLFPYLLICSSPAPKAPEALSDIGAREGIVALELLRKPFEYFLHLVINHQLALSPSPFQIELPKSVKWMRLNCGDQLTSEARKGSARLCMSRVKPEKSRD
jgi:hypothetical protein